MEKWSAHQLQLKAEKELTHESDGLIQYAKLLKSSGFPVIFTLRHLAKITNTDYFYLHNVVQRKIDKKNYSLFSIKKRSGGYRFIHTVCAELHNLQSYINKDVLQLVSPHRSSYAFFSGGGIYKCALQHCGARWILRFDLKDFFYTISEDMVFNVFRNLGYKDLLAFEMARICTTCHLPNYAKVYCKRGRSVMFRDETFPYAYRQLRGVLPQGAPSSPMVSNLVAVKLDELLHQYSIENGFTYTRYADDITLSALKLPNCTSIGAIQNKVASMIYRSGFIENRKKRRVAGPGAKKLVLGLLVDGGRPRISRETYKRIDRLLYAINEFALNEVAEHDKFDSPFGLFNHLHGLICFVKDVDPERWEEFDRRFAPIKKQFEADFKILSSEKNVSVF